MGTRIDNFQEWNEIEEFLYLEAALADESRYDEWEELLEPDMVYWVPRGEGDFDPRRHVSIINDNRPRLATRLRQLKTGTRHSQTPPSLMRRLLSNIRPRRTGPAEYHVHSNFALFEMQMQSIERLVMWAGRVEHKLRRTEAGLRMHSKKVVLVNGGECLPSLAFLI
jgi:3-phenylpropionate/cinnamic acid dioxygenase small subunit